MGVQVLGELDGGLPAKGHHHADGLFHGDDVHHILGIQGLKVQPVGGIVVGGYRFRVVVDNHHVIAHFPERPYAVHRAVIKLNALADADRARAQHHHHRPSAAGKAPALAGHIHRRIEIGPARVEYRGAGFHDAEGEGHGRERLGPAQALDGGVGVAQQLALAQVRGGGAFPGQLLLIIGQRFELFQEVGINHGDPVNFLHGHAGLDGFKHRKDAPVVLGGQALSQGKVVQRGGVQRVQADLGPADGFHQRRLKGGRDGHHLAGGLHLRAQAAAGAGELVKGPFGELDHDVIHRRLKAQERHAGVGVPDFIQRVAQRQPRGDLGDGIARGLAGQGGGTGYPGIDLNNGVLAAVGL